MSNPFRDELADKIGDDEIIEAEAVDFDFAARYSPPPATPVFHVPTRFGMSAILGITTALAILFGILRMSGAPVSFYWFFTLLSLIICVVQMKFGEVPRQGSIAAGAILLPIFVIVAAILDGSWHHGDPTMLVFCALGGAFFGYLTGTCLGGVFLLMDLFEKFWTRNQPSGTTVPGK